MAAVWRHYSVESIASGDMVGFLSAVLRCLLLPELIFVGAMYAVADAPKTMALSGLTKSRYPLAVSS